VSHTISHDGRKEHDEIVLAKVEPGQIARNEKIKNPVANTLPLLASLSMKSNRAPAPAAIQRYRDFWVTPVNSIRKNCAPALSDKKTPTIKIEKMHMR
jgi:hypothetical protein